MIQRAMDIHKIGDLKAVRHGDTFEWCIDYQEFEYRIGTDYVRSRTGVDTPWEIWPLEKSTKAAANRKVFEVIK